MSKRLTERQRKFVAEYFKTGNAFQSAVKAGYTAKYAKDANKFLLENTGVKKALSQLAEKAEDKQIADAKEVLQFLTRVLRGQERETVIIATPTGVEKSEKEPDIKTRLSAGRELLKRYPGDDKMAAQLLKKAVADATLAEQKAKLAEYEVQLRQAEFGGDDDAEREDTLTQAINQGMKEVFDDASEIEE